MITLLKMQTVPQHMAVVGIPSALFGSCKAPLAQPKGVEGDIQGHPSDPLTGESPAGQAGAVHLLSHEKTLNVLMKSAWHIPEQLLDQITSCQISTERTVT